MICPTCHGNGYVRGVDGYIAQCETCNSRGEIAQCETCNSRGEIEELKDADHKLIEGAARLLVGGFAIRVYKTDEGVVCDIYSREPSQHDCLASTCAFDSELLELKDAKTDAERRI